MNRINIFPEIKLFIWKWPWGNIDKITTKNFCLVCARGSNQTLGSILIKFGKVVLGCKL